MRGLTYTKTGRTTTRLPDVYLRGGCIGPTDAFFALAPRRERGRVGAGTASQDIADVVSSNNALQLGAEGLTVSGTDAPVINEPAVLTSSSDVSFVVEWTGMAAAPATKRTLLRAQSIAGAQYVELFVTAAGVLTWDVNGTTITFAGTPKDSGTHRAAVTYDAAGNIAGSFDGAAVVTGISAVEPINIDIVWIGNNNGATQCECALRAPLFGLGIEMNASQLVDASTLATEFNCGVFPQSMALGAFDGGFSSGFLN